MTEPSQPVDGRGPAVPLGWSLREPFTPGTNLRGTTTGGTLAFALPSLAVERIGYVGEPGPGTRTMLERVASEVAPVALDGSGAATPVDVLWVSGADGPARVATLGEPAADALLARTPSIVVEDASSDAGSDLEARLRAAGRQVAVLDTLVIDGEVRAAGPRMGPAGHPDHPSLPGIRRPSAGWSLRGRSAGSRSGRALIAAQDDPHDPPNWVVRLAADHGHDIRGHRWSIAAPGVYDSQKVLVYLTEPGGAAPSWIVKVTRGARHAERLQNEARGLAFLAGLGPIDGMTVPGLIGSGQAGGLAAVIETIVPGRPFEPVLRGAGGEARLAPAFEGLGGLAERSAHPVPATSVATTFGRLLDQYVAIHEPPTEDRARLAGWSNGSRPGRTRSTSWRCTAIPAPGTCSRRMTAGSASSTGNCSSPTGCRSGTCSIWPTPRCSCSVARGSPAAGWGSSPTTSSARVATAHSSSTPRRRTGTASGSHRSWWSRSSRSAGSTAR